jgi:hypothetical protein
MTALGSNAFADDSTQNSVQNNAHIEGILAGSWQTASESHVAGQKVEDEGNGELYLFGTMNMGPGAWNLELRGSTTPRTNGVSSFYDSNALVGETTDENGDGRIAATQFYYELPVAKGQLRAGLLDPTALLDGSEVANDEYTQFMAPVFVNNPSIGFPSFVAGTAFQGEATSNLNYKLFVGSDSGLQENDATYDDTFDLDGNRGTHRKGAFTSAELGWHNDKGFALKGGVWYDTGKLDYLDGTDDANPYGIYAIVEAAVGSGQLQSRLGLANNKTQEASNFVSVAWQQPFKLAQHDSTLGVAIARTGASSKQPSGTPDDAIYQAEAYWRINVAKSFYVSPDVQYIINPGFDSDQDNVLIGGLRASLEF